MRYNDFKILLNIFTLFLLNVLNFDNISVTTEMQVNDFIVPDAGLLESRLIPFIARHYTHLIKTCPFKSENTPLIHTCTLTSF